VINHKLFTSFGGFILIFIIFIVFEIFIIFTIRSKIILSDSKEVFQTVRNQFFEETVSPFGMVEDFIMFIMFIFVVITMIVIMIMIALKDLEK
jgi:hypothetical protein